MSLTSLLKPTAALAIAIATLSILSASATLALDCAKAATNVEREICANPRLKIADDAMAAAYSALRKRLRGNDLKMLAASQRKWLRGREEQPSRILDLTESRRRFLLGAPDSGKGIGERLIPIFLQKDGSPRSYDVNFELLKFAKPRSPVEKILNTAIDKILDEADLSENLGETASEGTRNFQTASAALAFASEKFLSLRIYSTQSFGGAQGMRQTQAINVELDRGTLLDIGKLFGTTGLSILKKQCAQQLLLQKIEQLGEKYRFDDDPSYNDVAMEKALKSSANWTFWENRAELIFNVGDIGSYREPEYLCSFTTDSLPLMAEYPPSRDDESSDDDPI